MEGRVLRHFAIAIVIAAAACASAPAAHATQFLTAIEDVPLPQGLTEKPEPLIFESDQGRVVRTSADGNVGGERIAAFYAQTLPALGWKLVEGPEGVLYAREDERLPCSLERCCAAANEIEHRRREHGGLAAEPCGVRGIEIDEPAVERGPDALLLLGFVGV